jgi:hypothetical protein
MTRAQVLCPLYLCPEHGVTWYVERGADIGEEIRAVWRCSQCDRIVEPLDGYELMYVDHMTPDNYTLDRPDLIPQPQLVTQKAPACGDRRTTNRWSVPASPNTPQIIKIGSMQFTVLEEEEEP